MTRLYTDDHRFVEILLLKNESYTRVVLCLMNVRDLEQKQTYRDGDRTRNIRQYDGRNRVIFKTFFIDADKCYCYLFLFCTVCIMVTARSRRLFSDLIDTALLIIAATDLLRLTTLNSARTLYRVITVVNIRQYITRSLSKIK